MRSVPSRRGSMVTDVYCLVCGSSLTSHTQTPPRNMDEEGSGRLLREVPSAALNRLFLELHDHLPRDTRERFAKLADEVRKLTETSTADALETQPPSADHGGLRREEEIGTVEAKQSSGGLIERGEVHYMLDSFSAA